MGGDEKSVQIQNFSIFLLGFYPWCFYPVIIGSPAINLAGDFNFRNNLGCNILGQKAENRGGGILFDVVGWRRVAVSVGVRH